MKLTKKQTDILNKSFHVSSVSRLDVAEVMHSRGNLTPTQANRKALKLTDSYMEQLSDRMGDFFCDSGYWDSIEAWIDKDS